LSEKVNGKMHITLKNKNGCSGINAVNHVFEKINHFMLIWFCLLPSATTRPGSGLFQGFPPKLTVKNGRKLPSSTSF